MASENAWPILGAMSILSELVTGISNGRIAIIDLTAPLDEHTPILRLPPPLGNTASFALEEISRYDERGLAWYWNNIRTGEHTGTHLDAPVHWVTGAQSEDVSRVPVERLIAPAVVLDFSAEAAANPDFLLEIDHVRKWEKAHGALPAGGWLLYRTGWDARADREADFLNDGHTPGISLACARWLAAETPIIGVGVETVGTDAGAAHSFTPPFPCHAHMLGAGKYGLTQLRRLSSLPSRGAVVIAGPLPIVGGSGSPCRVLALVEMR